MTFVTPILLIGLLTAGIPLLLHLISRIRAQQEYFPTLRFLKLSMDKTARRRRIENWFLLLLRCLLLGFLAIAVAQPITKAAGGWLGEGDSGQVSVILLDNSYSMGTVGSRSGTTRFDLAKSDTETLLSGDSKPSKASIITTTGKSAADYETLSGRLDVLRKQLAGTKIETTPAVLRQRFVKAVDMLKNQSNPRMAVYIFSDLQQLSFDALEKLQTLDMADARLFIVDYSREGVNNVGVTDLEIKNRPIVDSRMEFTVTVVNSSPAPRRMEVLFRIDGREEVQRAIVKLGPAGENDAAGKVRFYSTFSRAGVVSGLVELAEPDDLMIDNTRKFRIEIGPVVRALVVSPAVTSSESQTSDPGAMLKIALDWRREHQQHLHWPIRVDSATADSLTLQLLKKYDAVFLCDIPIFSDSVAHALSQYTRDGGITMFFLGGDVQVDNYNSMFYSQDGGLLPAMIGPAVGEIGSTAGAESAEIDITSPYFAGLFDSASDYGGILVQRHFVFPKIPDDVGRVDIRLSGGDVLLVERKVGRGSALWFTTSCSPRWTNFPTTRLFLPMVVRVGLSARGVAGGVKNIAENPFGAESNLVRVDPEKLKNALESHGFKHVYIGKSLEDVTAVASVDSQGKNWWGIIVAVVILMLVVESLVVTHRRSYAR